MASPLFPLLLFPLLPPLLLLIPLLPTREHLRLYLRSVLVHPLLTLFSLFYPLQPLLPLLLPVLLLTLLPLLALLLLNHLLTIAFANSIEAISATFRLLDLAPFFALLRPFDHFTIPSPVSDAFATLLATLKAACPDPTDPHVTACLASLQDPSLPAPPSPLSLFLTRLRLFADCPPIRPHLDPLSAALSTLLASLNLSSFFLPSDLPPAFLPPLDELSATITSLAPHINLTQLCIENVIPPAMLPPLFTIPITLSRFADAANFSHIRLTAVRRPGTQEALDSLLRATRDPAHALSIAIPYDQFPANPSVWVPQVWTNGPWPLRLALVSLVAVIASLPLLFLLRFICVEHLKKAILLRYHPLPPASAPAQPRARAFIHAGVVVGLAYAAAEAAPSLFICALLHLAGFHGLRLAVHVVCHAAAAACTQARVAERIVNTQTAVTGAMWRMAAFQVVLTVGWWMFAVDILTGGVWRPVVVDALAIGMMLVWVRKVVEQGIQTEEELARKRD